MGKLETQITAAITGFTVILIVSAVASLGFFVHLNKESDNFCLLFVDASATSPDSKTSVCNFIIASEAINVFLSLVAMVSIAVSTFMMPATKRSRIVQAIALGSIIITFLFGIGSASTLTSGFDYTCRSFKKYYADSYDISIKCKYIGGDSFIASIVYAWVQVVASVLTGIFIVVGMINEQRQRYVHHHDAADGDASLNSFTA